LSSATGDSGAFTLAYCAGCANTFTSCYSVDVATGNNSDCGYLYYTGSTITLTSSLIVTRSALAGAWRWWYVDVTRNTGTPTYDVANSRDQSTSTYNPSGVTLVGYTGSNDVVVQSISAGNAAYSCGGSNPGTPFSWIGSYTESALGSAGVAILPGTGSIGTPPTWCTSYSKAALSAIAFY
jgi:hypothetical protein